MIVTTESSRRTAEPPAKAHSGPVTLINSFVVPAGREAAFLELWTQTSEFFRAQPGFVALRLHRALSPNASFRFVNVAEWTSAQAFAAAHAVDRFHELVALPGWREFASSPALYEVAAAFPIARSGGVAEAPPSLK